MLGIHRHGVVLVANCIDYVWGTSCERVDHHSYLQGVRWESMADVRASTRAFAGRSARHSQILTCGGRRGAAE